MEKQDLLVSMAIDHDFAGKASHCSTFFYLAQCSSSQDNHVIMEKDAKSKGKGKTHTKRIKGRKCSTEEQDVQGIDGQTKSLCRFQQGFFLCLTKWRFFFFFRLFFSFSLPKDFVLLLIFPQE